MNDTLAVLIVVIRYRLLDNSTARARGCALRHERRHLVEVKGDRRSRRGDAHDRVRRSTTLGPDRSTRTSRFPCRDSLLPLLPIGVRRLTNRVCRSAYPPAESISARARRRADFRVISRRVRTALP